VSRIIAVLLMSMGLAWGAGAQAQTACPSGVGPGSAQCGPDSGTSRGDSAPPRPTGYWIKTWGAIAQSNVNGEVGTTVGRFSEEDARKDALRMCAKEGAPECKVQLVYHNQCAAIAAGSTGTTFQASQSEERATRLAKESCEKDGDQCKVLYSECTNAVFHRY